MSILKLLHVMVPPLSPQIQIKALKTDVQCYTIQIIEPLEEIMIC